MGVELTGKTLGVIGCGNIGSIAASRAIGLRMRVVAFDPFLSFERAAELGVEKVELDDLLARADFITLHTPLTAQTRNILSAENLAKTKKGVRIVNCARGGLVDEAALAAALASGQVAGAAFDVFAEEPATSNVLFSHPNFIATPHLGASTSEAQENVALQVAEQMSDYLVRGAITNAVNFPSITAEEAPKLKPFIALAEGLGSFAGQLTQAPIEKVTITYEGAVADLKTKALTSAAIAGLLRPSLQDVNVVSAPTVAANRGIVIDEVTRASEGDYESFITLAVTTAEQTRSIGGTVFHDGKPRILSIKGIKVDAEFTPSMIYVTNDDKPGFIGRFASLLGDADVNIATFALGRDEQGGSAIALVAIDGEAPARGYRQGEPSEGRETGDSPSFLRSANKRSVMGRALAARRALFSLARAPGLSARVRSSAPCLYGARFSLFVDRDESESGVGDLLAEMAAKPPRPGFDMDLDRGSADFVHGRIDAKHVADLHRPDEGHGVDRDGDNPSLRRLDRSDAARLIHLTENPAAKNIAVRVRIARHGDEPDGQIPSRLVLARRRFRLHGCPLSVRLLIVPGAPL